MKADMFKIKKIDVPEEQLDNERLEEVKKLSSPISLKSERFWLMLSTLCFFITYFISINYISAIYSVLISFIISTALGLITSISSKFSKATHIIYDRYHKIDERTHRFIHFTYIVKDITVWLAIALIFYFTGLYKLVISGFTKVF